MGSGTPKVLLPVLGRPMVDYVMDALGRVGIRRVVVVVGEGRTQVEAQAGRPGVEFAFQPEQRGTADAVLSCRGLIAADEECVVLCGDAPLVTSTTLGRLIAAFHDSGADVVVLTAEIAHPRGYGRIVRKSDGMLASIVEERDASDEVRQIREVNAGVYVFRWGRFLPFVEGVAPSPVTGEYYLTEALRALVTSGGRAQPVRTADPNEILGANTPEQLAEVEAELAHRLAGNPS